MFYEHKNLFPSTLVKLVPVACQLFQNLVDYLFRNFMALVSQPFHDVGAEHFEFLILCHDLFNVFECVLGEFKAKDDFVEQIHDPLSTFLGAAERLFSCLYGTCDTVLDHIRRTASREHDRDQPADEALPMAHKALTTLLTAAAVCHGLSLFLIHLSPALAISTDTDKTAFLLAQRRATYRARIANTA